MQDRSFASILEDKLKAKSEGPLPTQHDPAYLSFLLGQISQTRIQSQISFKQYRKHQGPKKQKVQEEKAQEPIVEVPKEEVRTPHLLSPEQEKAFDFFIQNGAILRQDFSQAELKAAFRKLARCFHPDTCDEARFKSGLLFMELKRSNDLLKKVFQA